MERIKNVCILSQTLLAGGAEKQALLLAQILNSDFNVTLIIYYGNEISTKSKEIINNTRISITKLKGNHLSKALQLYKIFRKKKIEIVFLYLLLPNFIGGIVGKLAGIKHTIGGVRSSKIEKKKLIAERFLHNFINHRTIFNNFSGFEHFSKIGFFPSKGVVIPNCFDLATKPIPRNNKDTITVLTVGRFHYAKDYQSSIKAISHLKDKIENLQYVIIGWGESELEIRNWIKQYDVEGITRVIIKPNNLYNYYIQADIYLQTSIFEGLSNTIMEALSYSLPVVTTDVGDNGRLVISGKTGYLCPTKHTEAIAGSIEKLVNNSKLRNQFGIDGYNLLKQNYSLKIFKKQYIDFINGLS